MSTVMVMASQLAAARNYVYETNMGDYSASTINYAQREYAVLKQEVEGKGFSVEDLIVWNGGYWVPKQ